MKKLMSFLIVNLLMLSSVACSAQERCEKNVVVVTVRAGDTITSIGQSYHCSDKEISKLTKKYGNKIKPGEPIELSCECKRKVEFITNEDINSIYNGKPSNRIVNLKNMTVNNGGPGFIEINDGSSSEVVKVENFSDKLVSSGNDLKHKLQSIRFCNSEKECGNNVYQRTHKGDLYSVESASDAHSYPNANYVQPHPPSPQAAAQQQAPVILPQAAAQQQAPVILPQAAAQQQAPVILPQAAAQQQAPVSSPLGLDECAPLQGQVLDPKGVPLPNAKVTLLVPNVSAFEHTSIRDSGNVLVEALSGRNGVFRLNKNLNNNFKYTILVEANGYSYVEEIVDLTKGCNSLMIKIPIAQ